jgi:dienelactone hydrolase
MRGHSRYAKPEFQTSRCKYVPFLSMDGQDEAIWVTNCMCPKNYRAPVFLLLFAVVLSAATSKAAVEQKRRFTSRDSVEMSYFGTLIHADPSELDDDGIVSPNGRYVVKIAHRGVLPEGVTEGTIWLFDAAEVKKCVNTESARVPTPIPLVRMSAAANGLYAHFNDTGNTIFQPTWADDSRSLTFLGRNGRENRQLFRVDVDTQEIKALSPETQDVVVYSRSGAAFAYLASADVKPEQEWVSSGPGIPDMTIGTGTPLLPLLYPHFVGESFSHPATLQLWRVRGDMATPVIDPTTTAPMQITTTWTAFAIALSPNASQVVTIASVIGPSTGDADVSGRPLKYRVIDVQEGKEMPSLETPIADYEWHSTGRYRAVWSPDGTEVALSETNLSATQGEGGDSMHRCTVAVVDVARHKTQCGVVHDAKASTSVHSMRWDDSGKHLFVRFKQSGTGVYSTKTLGRKHETWTVLKRSPKESSESLVLTVNQSLNAPPVLVAYDEESGRSRPIFDPNPQLADVDMGSASVYTWRDPQGRTIHGGLVKPPGWTPAKRYPLVIQTHGFDAKSFFRVGYDDTSNAGRALAGRDMIVLQVKEPGGPHSETWQAGTEEGEDVYLAAIDQLTAEGVIDPKKVGITGYSYTGLLVTTAIVRAPDRFAAAAMADTDPGTLLGHSTYVDEGTMSRLSAELVAGALPYGDGLKTWLDRAAALSSEKISAPVLYTAADPWHLIAFWELYASLREQGKPVELQYFRSGQHSIRKPLQRWAHQEMLVDWFDFWLNDHEDPDTSKAEQYGRWHKLREMQSAEHSPPR